MLSAFIFSCLFSIVALGQEADTPFELPSSIDNSVVEVFCFHAEPDSTKPIAALNPFARGAGVVISEDGAILTNRHLLGDPESAHYRVLIRDTNQLIKADLLAADSWSDLAVLKVDNENLQPVKFVDSQLLIVDLPVAIYPSSISRSRTFGTIAGFPELTITDQATRMDSLAYDCLYQYGGLIRINTNESGFISGAGVFDPVGNMVALTTALVPILDDSRDHIAIPIDAFFRQVIDTLARGELPEYGFLGITSRDLSKDQKQSASIQGLQVVEVVTNSPADIAGLRFTDVITHIDDVAIFETRDLLSVLGRQAAGATIRIRGVRGALKHNETREEFDVRVRLSGRLVETRRKSWQRRPAMQWRGLKVDYPFAVSRYQVLLPSIDPEGCVVISDVQLGSPAWQAGLRPRAIVTRVDSERVDSPNSFYERVNPSNDRPVVLTVIDAETGDPITFSVENG